MFKRLKNDKGALVVEASIVFPITFLVVFLMLFMGNVYLQKSRIESIVSQMAIKGAATCADPMLSYVQENKSIPELGAVDIQPYRYVGSLLGGMGTIEGQIKNEIISQIDDVTTGLFTGMEPAEYASNLTVKYNSSFVAASFSIDLKYKIEFPMRLMGQTENLSMTFSTHSEVPVGDTPEFIRNINMVEDYMELTGATAKIEQMIEKVKEFVNN